MKTKFALFTSVIFAAFCFASCSLVSDDSIPGVASAEFSMSPELARAIYSKTQGDNYNHELEYKFILRTEVELSGTYTQKKTIDVDLTEIDEKKTSSEEVESVMVEKLTAEKIRFEDIPVGSRVKADVKIYSVYQQPEYGEGVSTPEMKDYSKLIIKGSSDTVLILAGENNISVQLEYVIKSIPVKISFTYEDGSDIPASTAQLSYMNIYALKKGSELADMYYNLYKDGSGEDTDFYSLMSVSSSSDCLGHAYVSTYNMFETDMKYDEASNSISGTIKLPVGEDVVLLGQIYYSDSASSKPLLYVAHPAGDTLEDFRAKSVNADLNGINTSLVLSKFNIALNTQYVLYQKIQREGKTQYMYNLSSSASEIGESAGISEINTFCFDEDGFLYYLGVNSDKYVFKSSKSSSFEVETSITYDSFLNNMPSITVDHKKNIMYLANLSGGCDLSLTQYPELISSGTLGEAKNFYHYNSIDNNFLFNKGTPFAVYHDKAYFVVQYNDSTKSDQLYVIDLSKAVFESDVYRISEGQMIDLGLDEIKGNKKLIIYDMIYQNGAVYMLVKQQVLENTDSFYSRGGVIRYDVSTGAVKTIGWTSNPITFDESNPTYYYAYNNSGDQYRISGSSNYSTADKVLFRCNAISEEGKEFVQLYSPAAETDGFYGPVKFIAVKPKQLVIADDGIAFYTDSLGAYRLKNVNRVVIVDLETFALTLSDVADEITFDGEYSNGSNFIAPKSSLYANGTEISFYNAATRTVLSGGCIYHGSSDGGTQLSSTRIDLKPVIPTVAE